MKPKQSVKGSSDIDDLDFDEDDDETEEYITEDGQEDERE